MTNKLYKKTLRPMLDEDGNQIRNGDGYPMQEEIEVEFSKEEYAQRENDIAKALTELPAQLIRLNRVIASEKINAIAPIYKQVNLIRESNFSDPLFVEIDAIRTKSNQIEDVINGSTSEQLKSFSIKTAWE